jgi:hypothetical protein
VGGGQLLSNRRRREILASVLVALPLAVTAVTLAGCSSGTTRSAASVCGVWQTQAVALHSKYASDAANTSKNPLRSLIDLIRTPNDLAVLMDNMGAVAPMSIEPSFDAVGAFFDRLSSSESKAMTDPLGAIIGNFVPGLEVSGPYQRVNQYIWVNCHGPGTSHPN